jgi:uncharacterized membrane protein (UPF0136 family)
MISLIAGQVILGIYAVLLAVGGYIGYTKAGSKPSLIAGAACAVGVLIATVLSFWNKGLGLGIAALLALLLCIFFGRRYATTTKFMPGGLLAIVSLVVLCTTVLTLIGY